MTDERHVSELVERLANHRILVVGDVMIDEYLVGRAVRLSHEAPVPVLEQTHGFAVLGGAGNPARNRSALGSQAVVAGVIDRDEAAVQLVALLRDAEIGDEGLYDVVGAGDTVVSVLTLALAGGLSLRSAAYLGNVAGGLVVRRLANAVVTGSELTQAFLERSAG